MRKTGNKYVGFIGQNHKNTERARSEYVGTTDVYLKKTRHVK